MKVITSILASSALLYAGCNAGPEVIPSRVGLYTIQDEARDPLYSYFDRTVQKNLKRVMEHVFSQADVNMDNIIDEDEAYEAINIVRPFMRKAYNEILNSGKEKEATAISANRAISQ